MTAKQTNPLSKTLTPLFLSITLLLAFVPQTSLCQSAFGTSAQQSRDYSLDIIQQFQPALQQDEIKCKDIPGVGHPIRAIKKFNEELSKMFNPQDPNVFVRMFFFKDELVNKDRIYKYGIEVKSFTRVVYIAIKLVLGGTNPGVLPEEMFLMTTNPQLLPVVLEAGEIDLKNFLGCGDLKTLFSTAPPM